MSQVMNNPNYRNLADIVKEAEYDGKTNVLPDRKTGWKVRNKYLDRWIEPIQFRGTTDDIVKAFDEIAEKAYACGYQDAQDDLKNVE